MMKPKLRRQDNTKRDPEEIRRLDAELIYMAQDKVKQQGTIKQLINFRILAVFDEANSSRLFNLQAPCVLYIGQAFHYSPENAFDIFNQQIYFII